MGKRPLIISSILVLTAIIGTAIFLICKRSLSEKVCSPYEAVPLSSCVILETTDLQSSINTLIEGGGLANEWTNIKEWSDLHRNMKLVADNLNKPDVKELTQGRTSVFSIVPSEGGKFSSLLAIAVNPSLSRGLDLKRVLKSSTSVLEEMVMGDNNVYLVECSSDSSRFQVYVTLTSGLILCTPSKDLLNEALVTMPQDVDIRNQPGVSRVMASSGEKENKIYLLFDNVNPLFKPLLNDKYTSLVDKISSLATTIEGDIHITNNDLNISGYIESIDSTDLLYRFKSDAAGTFQSFRILPSATALFESMIPVVIDDKQVMPKSTSEVMKLASIIKSYVVEEVSKAYVDIKDKPVDENFVNVYKLTDRAVVEQLFIEEFNGYQGGEISFFSPDDQVRIPIYHLPFKGFGKAMFSNYMWDINDTFATFYDNFLITGSSLNVVSKVLYDNILNKTLSNDMIYRDFETTLPSVAGYSLYMVPSRLSSLLERFASEKVMTLLKANKTSIDRIQAVGYQLVSSNKMIYNSLSIKYVEEVRQESEAEWETLLEAEAAIKPFFFTNHISGAKEIFIQDVNNNIYLINAAGRVLWKVPLNERINGSIYSVDFYQNGKYQLLFAGNNYLHLIDRNGNYVERYPVKLRSEASNTLALFDYDNTKNYRLVIAGRDNQVYAYDKSGNVVKGWKLFKTNSEVVDAISWFRVSGKDYLIVTDKSTIYFLDRTGNRRLTLKESVSKSPGSSIRFVAGSASSVVCTDSEGTIQHVKFDGTVEKITPRSFSANHSFDAFDVTGDGTVEYVFLDKGVMFLYDRHGKEIFSRSFPSENIMGPIPFTFSNFNRKIGVYDVDNKQIYLVDADGDVTEGFPLDGASLFSIGKLSTRNGWNLIVGGRDKFLYNYEILME